MTCVSRVRQIGILPSRRLADFDRNWIACYSINMLTFHHPFVEMPLACRRTFAVLGAGLFLLSTHASGQKTSPATLPPTTPKAASSPASAVSGSVVGRIIQFTSDSERYRISGWSKTEGNNAWTEGTSARLALPIPLDAGPLTLRMTLRGLIQPPTLPSQPVEVYANEQKVADWLVAETAVFTAEIPEELTKRGGATLSLQLRIPKAASPKSLGLNADERVLGVSCYSVELKKG